MLTFADEVYIFDLREQRSGVNGLYQGCGYLASSSQYRKRPFPVQSVLGAGVFDHGRTRCVLFLVSAFRAYNSDVRAL